MLNVDQDLLFPANKAYHWRSSIELQRNELDFDRNKVENNETHDSVFQTPVDQVVI
jgi:hypothetical protein